MSPRDLAELALIALARHRLRTSMSLLGVAIGVAAVVVLTGLGEGARRYVTGQFSSIGSNLVILIPGRNETTGVFPGVSGVANDLTLDDARALERSLPRLRRLAPVSMGNETVAHRARRRQVAVVGSTHDFLGVRQLTLAAGQFLPAGELGRGGQSVVLGAKVARELFPSRGAVGRVVRIGDWRMRVIGVLQPLGAQLGMNVDDMVIVPAATGMQMFNRSSLYRILLQMESHEDMEATCPLAVALLEERHDEEDVTCITQESVVSSLTAILTVLTLAVGGIGAISLVVAGIGIMNLMLVSVSERTAEVGLLKAIGARAAQIRAVFLAEAVLLAGLGGGVGLGFGWGVIRLLAWLYPGFPAATPLWAVTAAFATSLVVGALFGVLPAHRATRLDPVAALAGK